MEMKIKISIFLVKLCCNLMILAKKPEVNRNFAKKMPNYSCGGCCWFLGFTLVALKAHIFHMVGRKYFPLVSFKRAWKNLSEAHEFCPVSFKNGVTVISQSTVKIVFFRCLTNPTLSSCIFQVNGDWTSPRGQQSRASSYNNTDCLKMSENVKKYYRMSKNNKKC